MRLYLIGPMSGIEAYNVEAFEAAALKLREQGHTVTTPHEANNAPWFRRFGRDFNPRVDRCDWGDPILCELLAEDARVLYEADALAVLPGWEYSKGSRLEIAMAKAAGKPVLRAEDLEPLDAEVTIVIRPKAQTEPPSIEEVLRARGIRMVRDEDEDDGS